MIADTLPVPLQATTVICRWDRLCVRSQFWYRVARWWLWARRGSSGDVSLLVLTAH